MLNTEKIRLRRHELRLSQVELAEKIGISQTHFSAIECGDRGVSIEVAVLIAKALKFQKVDDIILNPTPPRDRRPGKPRAKTA